MNDKQILQQFIPWIYKLAGKYSQNTTHYLEFEDLVSVGSMAVFDARKKYDPNNKKAAKLNTYTMNHIRHRMQSAMRDAGNLNNSQQNAMIMISSWLKVIGEDATIDEIVEYSQTKYSKGSSYHWNRLQVERYLQLWNTKTYALGVPLDPHDSDSVVTNIAKSNTNIEAEYSVLEEKQLLYNEINNLEPRMRRVLIGRIIEERTLDDLGREFKVSRERIRQIETKALKMVKHRLSVKLKEHKPAKMEFKAPKPKKVKKHTPKRIVIPKPVKKTVIPDVPKVSKKPEYENVSVAEARLPKGTKVTTLLGFDCIITEDLDYKYEAYVASVDKYIVIKDNEIISNF